MIVMCVRPGLRATDFLYQFAHPGFSFNLIFLPLPHSLPSASTFTWAPLHLSKGTHMPDKYWEVKEPMSMHMLGFMGCILCVCDPCCDNIRTQPFGAPNGESGKSPIIKRKGKKRKILEILKPERVE